MASAKLLVSSIQAAWMAKCLASNGRTESFWLSTGKSERATDERLAGCT
jgi:hypothetical protein